MARKYIIIDPNGQAELISEDRIQDEASERLRRGETFEIFQAEPMRINIGLSPLEEAAPAPARATRGRGARRASKRTPTETGRVGRPKVNVGACEVPGCGRPQKTRGLCSAHYQQHRRLVRQGKPGLIVGENGGGEAAPEARPGRTRRGGKKAAGARKAARKPAARKKAAKKAGRKTGSRKASKKAGGSETAAQA